MAVVAAIAMTACQGTAVGPPREDLARDVDLASDGGDSTAADVAEVDAALDGDARATAPEVDPDGDGHADDAPTATEIWSDADGADALDGEREDAELVGDATADATADSAEPDPGPDALDPDATGDALASDLGELSDAAPTPDIEDVGDDAHLGGDAAPDPVDGLGADVRPDLSDGAPSSDAGAAEPDTASDTASDADADPATDGDAAGADAEQDGGDTAHDSALADAAAIEDAAPEIEDTIPPDTTPPDTTPPDTTPTDTTPPDTTPLDTAPPDTATADTRPRDTVPVETVTSECGDGVADEGEACDDGNACLGDGCGACRVEPTYVIDALALSPIGFDLDDADADGDVTTGVDNRLAALASDVRSDLPRRFHTVLSAYLSDLVARGEVIELLTLAGADDALVARLHPGRALTCARGSQPWADDGAIAAYAQASCDPATLLGTRAGERLALAGTGALRLAQLGTWPLARAHLEATIDDAGEGALSGVLGAVVPVSALGGMNSAQYVPLCPSALHVALGYLGQPDADANGDGRHDSVLFDVEPGKLPCVDVPVVIRGCCVGGDCDAGHIDGADCLADGRMADGYSVAFALGARAAHVSALVDDGPCAPPEPPEVWPIEETLGGESVSASFVGTGADGDELTTLEISVARSRHIGLEEERRTKSIKVELMTVRSADGTPTFCRLVDYAIQDPAHVDAPDAPSIARVADGVAVSGTVGGIDCMPGQEASVPVPIALTLESGATQTRSVSTKLLAPVVGDSDRSTNRVTQVQVYERLEVAQVSGAVGGVTLDHLAPGDARSRVMQSSENWNHFVCADRQDYSELDLCGGSSAFDGCTRPFVCAGGCDLGERCLDGGFCCHPMTCEDRGVVCGPSWDGCDTDLDCGTCAEGLVCNFDASACCAPSTCETTGRECGRLDDPCTTNSYDCGTCEGIELCDAEGRCVLPDPPPPGDQALRCACWDGTQVDACVDVACEPGAIADACGWSCLVHGGVASGTCRDPGGVCAPAYLPRDFGPNLATCTCADDTTLSVCNGGECADVADTCRDACLDTRGVYAKRWTCEAGAYACSGVAAPPAGVCQAVCICNESEPRLRAFCTTDEVCHEVQAGLCSPLCGGFTQSGWYLDALDVCEPRFQPARHGTTAARCVCHDGATLEVCADIACEGADAYCADVCRGHDGLAAATCAGDDPACRGAVPPEHGPDLVKCACREGLVDLCFDTWGCLDTIAQRNACEATCAERGGLDLGWYQYGVGCEASSFACVE